MKRKSWLALVGLAMMVSACAQPAPLPEDTKSEVVAPAPDPLGAALVTLNDDNSGVIARPIDPATLDDLDGYEPIELGHHHNGTLSPDGSLWAVVKWPNGSSHGGTLHWIDMATWQEQATEIEFLGNISMMTFSPDWSKSGSRLVVSQVDWGNAASSADVMLITPGAPDVSVVAEVDFIPWQAGFSPDGETVYLYGSDSDTLTNEALPPQVAAIRLADGDVLWTRTLDGVLDGLVIADSEAETGVPLNEHQATAASYEPGVVFRQDGRWLYVVHPESEQLTRVDLSRGRLRPTTITADASLLERMMHLTARPAYAKGPMSGTELQAVYSRHVEHLYVTGTRRQVQWEENGNGTYTTPDVTIESLGLQVIEATTGRRLVEMEMPPVSQLALSADEERLFLVRQPDQWSEFSAEPTTPESPSFLVLNARRLEPVAETEFEAEWVYLGYTAGGSQPYLQIQRVSGPEVETTIQLLDAETGELTLSRDVEGWMGELVLPPA